MLKFKIYKFLNTLYKISLQLHFRRDIFFLKPNIIEKAYAKIQRFIVIVINGPFIVI